MAIDNNSPQTIADAIKEHEEFDHVPAPVEPEAVAPPEPEPEPTPEPEPVKPEPEAPAAYTHLPGMRRRALALGATTAQIEATSPEDLEAYLEANESRPSAKDEKEEELDLGVDTSELAPEMVEVLKGVAKKRDEKIKAQEARLAALEKRDQEREREAIYGRLDEAFDELPEALQKFLGTEANGSMEFRNAVLKKAGIDPRSLPPKKVLAKKLAEVGKKMFAISDEPPPEKKPEPMLNGKPRITKEDFAQAGLKTPTQKKGELKKGKRAAYEAVMDMFVNEKLHTEDNDE